MSVPQPSARAEARKAAETYRQHYMICRLRQSGEPCQWCCDLDTAALDAADAAGIPWEEARR